MSSYAFTQFRNVSIGYIAALDDNPTPAMPLDAYKAVTDKVQELEFLYFNNTSEVSDLAAAAVLLSSTIPGRTHKFTVTSTMATGTYLFVYVGTAGSPTAAAAL